jgi:protein-tyrosine phosphatase
MKQPLNILLIASLISCGTFAKSAPYCDGTEKNPCLVQDTQDSKTAIKHFRYASMLADVYNGNISGLKNLKMSGSGAPNTFEWNKIAEIIHTETHNKVITILDLDLRQETHGYLNDNSINLTSNYNWINLNKTLDEINIAEHDWLQSISKNSTVNNVITSAQFNSKDFTHGITLPVRMVTTEQSLVESLGYTYLRLPVTDHRTPLNIEVDRFVTLVKNLSSTTWLHIHCRGGKGRTTTFMAMYDMLKNADKVSFDEIIKRQAAVDPFYDLSDIQRSDSELSIYYKERYDFLRNFYNYAHAALHGYQGRWSEWVAKARK